MEAYAITVIAALAGATGAFFQKRAAQNSPQSTSKGRRQAPDLIAPTRKSGTVSRPPRHPVDLKDSVTCD